MFRRQGDRRESMYQIALCDDEIEQLHKTEQMLTEYRKSHPDTDFRVDCFESADELLEMVEEEYLPDLILMDIYMPDKLGIEAAKELRDMGNPCRIVFLTTSREHALDAFEVEAAQYLVKPLAEEKLFPLLNRFLKEMQEERKRYVLLRIDSTVRRVAVDDIVYCEAQGKFQYMHFSDGSQCMLRVTMGRLGEMLNPYPEFMRVGASFLINMVHIECISKLEIRMDTGKKLFPPRSSFQAVRERYFAYYCGE